MINNTCPRLEKLSLLKKFRNWEDGFEAAFRGETLEQVRVFNSNQNQSREEGWRNAQLVLAMTKDRDTVEAIRIERRRYKQVTV